jgi:hypothetical protein
MEYPALNPNAKLFKIYEKALSPYYDIVWSFDYYATSIPANSQLGICLFLQDSQGVSLARGFPILTSPDSLSYLAYPDDSYFFSYGLSADIGNNVDLGYAGLSANVDKGVIGVGLDTTGSFALSVSSLGALVRDGDLDSRRKLNSLSIRGQAPTYSWKEYSVNTALSAYNFNILETRKKTIRARLGNVGQTLYVDFRYSPSEDFVNILTQNVTFSRSLTSRFRPGVTFVKPVSGNAPVPVIRFSNFTVEGREGFTYVAPPSSSTLLETPVLDTSCLVSECEYKPYVPPVYAPYIPPPVIALDPAIGNRQHTGLVSINVDSAFNRGVDNGYSAYDLYNFGYNLNLYNNTTTSLIPLTRIDYFDYVSADNSITLSLSSFNSTWKLIGPGINYTNNSNARPIGNYSNYTISYT